jgi:hypothetical protein
MAKREREERANGSTSLTDWKGWTAGMATMRRRRTSSRCGHSGSGML